ncbi:MAG: hypothetical protein CR988_00475 [Treponema sp.]|nr:MAG: hypothetical protein CR988_00475 [Treponema sp.]
MKNQFLGFNTIYTANSIPISKNIKKTAKNNQNFLKNPLFQLNSPIIKQKTSFFCFKPLALKAFFDYIIAMESMPVLN